MSDSLEGNAQGAGDWDVYWRGTHENAAHREGGPQEAVLAEFWGGLFRQRLAGPTPARMLDLACGNGAVTGYAMRAEPQTHSFCADYSLSALLELKKRHPDSRCVVADALNTGFCNGAFDIVASQFGIEYAGVGALPAAARLVAPGGVLAVVLHLHDGGIFKECERNLQAVEAIGESGVLSLARDAFNAGFALNRGEISPEAFKAAEQKFTPAVRALENILHSFGGNVADGLAQQLYRDIAHMYQRMSAFDEQDIIRWIDGMVLELQAYSGRMSSMLAAAMTAGEVEDASGQLQQAGLKPLQQSTLVMGERSEPAAWALVLERA